MGRLGINPALFVAQLVNFGLIAFLLYRFLYQPVLNALQNRQQLIRESVENAEQVRAARQIIEGLGLEIATPDEARETLQLKGGDRVGF